MHLMSTKYESLWRRTARNLAFLLTSLPVAIAGSTIGVVGISLGAGLLIVWIGVPIVVGTLIVSRWFGSFEIARLRSAGQTVQAPDWGDPATAAGVWNWVRRHSSDPRYWKSLVHVTIINPVLSIATWTISLSWTLIGLAGIANIVWSLVGGISGNSLWIDVALHTLFPSISVFGDPVTAFVAEIVFDAAAGVVFIGTLPFVCQALVRVHASIARRLLGETAEVSLRREASLAEYSRGAAVLAEDRSLRQLERDIHDGPQQGLLRIQYDLASAERALPVGDEGARALVAGALRQSKETLDELRKLSQGLAPPLLQDRGLAAAVRSLAARSPVPVTTEFDLDADAPSLEEIERSAYFIVAELLANVVKHGRATRISVVLTTTSARIGPSRLSIKVVDDGDGGARIVVDGGLDGLRERISGLRGSMLIDSPVGGPTEITVHIPLSVAASHP
jgi:signal transduction histidine kinase